MLEDFKLFLIFDNGIIRTYSIEEKTKDNDFKPLTNLYFFKQVRNIENGNKLNWKNIYKNDISAKKLWQNSYGITSIEKLINEFRI